MRLLEVCALTAAAALLLACSDADGGGTAPTGFPDVPVERSDGDVTASDARPDTPSDPGPPDPGLTPDAGPDAAPDTRDAAPDTIPDADSDGALDAPSDATPDATSDTDPDTPADTPSDAAPDTPPADEPPSAPVASLSPLDGTVDTVFTCTIDIAAIDPEGHPVTTTLTWLVNGYQNPGPAPASVAPKNLAADADGTPPAPGDRLVCRADATDLAGNTATALSNEALLVALPRPPTVKVVAPDGAAGDLTCAIVDPGETTSEPSWRWQVGDEAEFEAKQVLEAELVGDCDLVRCRVVVDTPYGPVESEPAELLLPVGPDCDDADACTTATCAPTGGCLQGPNTAPCDDADVCTTADTCADGACIPGRAVDPTDGLACTVDACDPALGVSHTPDDAACEAVGTCVVARCDATLGCLTESVPDCCGNGVVEAGEDCDPAAPGGDACPDTCALGDPGWLELAPTWTHANATRLGPDHVAVAWTDGADRAVAATAVQIAVVTRAGDQLAAAAPTTVPIPVLPANSDQGLALMGALGPDHFFLVVTAAGYTRSIEYFRRDGDSVTHLGGQPWTDEAFFMGHPFDDTRYLLRYRRNNSGQPVFYRVLHRTGDAFSLGAELQRYDSSAFPGTDNKEPQTFAPLARLDAAGAFRELRAGYVWPISPLTSWRLDLQPGSTLARSDPRVHSNSSNKVMNPYAVADAAGAIVTIYHEYSVGYRAGYFDPATAAYVDHGPIPEPTGGVTIYAAGIESTDGHFDGVFYIRVQEGRLYKFPAYDAPPVLDESGLPWRVCYRGPSILKTGPLGVFLVCEVDEPLRLRFRAL